jgi:hypothetical protein
MENWKVLKKLVDDAQKDAEKAFIDGRGASAKRIRKMTLQLREAINKVREAALKVYRKEKPVE